MSLLLFSSQEIYSNVRWYVYMVQIATNVIYVKVLVKVAEICTTFKDNSNMQICDRSWLYIILNIEMTDQ